MISGKSWLPCFILLATVIPLMAQKPTETQRFAGTWKAKFQGNTFSTLKLSLKDSQLTGSMTGANSNLDKDGNLTSAQATGDEDQIGDVKLAGDTLSFTTKNEDTGEIINWKMRLTNQRQGELLLVLPEPHPDIPTPRPWKIVRSLTKP